ncbi:carbon-nitrogen hydrolase [Parathielavia appendiculata]|uniref:Carbon-nitrogen hydrolase n=1 Tax=Parathielavia appendiculata TaxID=2587402 RepID=A0AAN6TSF9_9PEZI|nr:carbon-nitrogen hydrolase [Parathielavia appendiculata]
MRIACLQFAPQVGDIDNNLSRADAALKTADPDGSVLFDMLVLPELAFTGYNFESLQHIYPSLEEAGSGISSLWARITALKHDCTVVVGYAEKVDAAAHEYYNSALIVNRNGNIVGNYRKSSLYYTDKTWARESAGGFFRGKMPGFGNVAMGIGTDLNPYQPDTPWDAFEFGIHIVKSQANVVILMMAWQTDQNPSLFGRSPQEPDVETLVYWVQRLEPVICADKEEEVIVVFCNRTGVEKDATYTGTSAVIGIKQGEILVYGVLGCGVVDLLIVDTDCPPRYRLTGSDSTEADEERNQACQPAPADPSVENGVDRPDEPMRTPRSPTHPQISSRYESDCSITKANIPGSPNTQKLAHRPSRPKLAIPSFTLSFDHIQSSRESWSAVFGGGATMTPITPFEEDGWSSTPIDPEPPQWYRKYESTMPTLDESIGEEEHE